MTARTLSLAAEVLLVGVLVCLAALPVVTSLAAAGAGSVLLRELVREGRTPTVRRFLSLVGKALRDPVAVVVPVVVLAVGVLDVLAVVGGLPGGRVIGPVIGLALAAVVIVLLRAAARWRPGDRWAARLAEPVLDPVGNLALLAALVVAVLVCAQAPAFVVVLPGLLVFAAVAVEGR
ncbi:hypothetical protein [Saccharothrix sp.]|uniref:hypothetical protein n=1 Tax=Saccharothrix sp. TaxID=1873460 RepID=UPI002811B19C|nr:hypothetical protein [Saccharothrix sp.]